MATTKRILIVEHDAATRKFLAEQLECYEGFVVVEAETGQEASALVEHQHFSIILMEVALPDTDGRDLCRLMRRQGSKTPIIMLTACDTDADVILGLDSGANDYITKPFRLSVLLARVRALYRQFELCDDATFPIGPYAFRLSTKFLIDTEADKRIFLTEKETAILKYLCRLGGRPASRHALLSEVWDYNAGVATHTIETHVYRLRQKIETNPTNAQILLTETDGYRLVR